MLAIYDKIVLDDNITRWHEVWACLKIMNIYLLNIYLIRDK